VVCDPWGREDKGGVVKNGLRLAVDLNDTDMLQTMTQEYHNVRTNTATSITFTNLPRNSSHFHANAGAKSCTNALRVLAKKTSLLLVLSKLNLEREYAQPFRLSFFFMI
jgi:hypothetical protein